VVATSKKPRARYSAERLVADMALRGWNNTDLARAASVSSMTVTRFLRGEAQTAKTAERLARALGYTARRYFSHVEAVAS
jgi:transcriptional regulator with XRE-family HTH domain